MAVVDKDPRLLRKEREGGEEGGGARAKKRKSNGPKLRNSVNAQAFPGHRRAGDGGFARGPGLRRLWSLADLNPWSFWGRGKSDNQPVP